MQRLDEKPDGRLMRLAIKLNLDGNKEFLELFKKKGGSEEALQEMKEQMKK
jgi:hypothetical protein